jgi:hypothetical protein
MPKINEEGKDATVDLVPTEAMNKDIEQHIEQ